ncbi:unnamed protein product [Closterium sp. NIES-65]|nr:unnamed protein product [Closterium sp. NIES-65]
MAAASAAANAALSTPVFVYGTLMADEVLRALLDRVPASAPARLPNFSRHSIKGRQYPAVVPKAHDSVMGKLLLNLSPPEMSLFDAFEDVEYVRSTQLVTLQGVRDSLLLPPPFLPFPILPCLAECKGR